MRHSSQGQLWHAYIKQSPGLVAELLNVVVVLLLQKSALGLTKVYAQSACPTTSRSLNKQHIPLEGYELD
jgi:hypothetical protein